MDLQTLRSCLEKEVGDWGDVIVEYKIAYGWGETFTNARNMLQKEVNNLINLGFKPQGSVQIVKTAVFINAVQAMIKED